VGLGSGSTASLAVRALARRVSQGLRISGIPTSEKTAALARELGIPLSTLAERGRVALTIDGADEVELGTLDLIKGLGGALLREKLVAAATTRLAIVVDESKLVDRLAADFRPLPVEVVAFAWQTTARRLESLGAEVTLRLGADGQPFVTDQGNLTLDCRFGAAPPARQLQPRLDATVGVVEHGLFLGMTSLVIVGGAGRVRVLEGRP
jgi:ribose 5-phosphate isomerase A